jgi:hypothetical protein
MLDAGLQERNITPYLYFIDNSKNDAIKILFANNKWPFSKGMTLFLWFETLTVTNNKILWLKTEDGHELIVAVNNGKLQIENKSKGEK